MSPMETFLEDWAHELSLNPDGCEDFLAEFGQFPKPAQQSALPFVFNAVIKESPPKMKVWCDLAFQLLDRGRPTPGDIEMLLKCFLEKPKFRDRDWSEIARHVQSFADRESHPSETVRRYLKASELHGPVPSEAFMEAFTGDKKVVTTLPSPPPQLDVIPENYPAWRKRSVEDMASLPAYAKPLWRDLLVFAEMKTDLSTPTGKWLNEAERLVNKVGKEDFAKKVCTWFPLTEAVAGEGHPFGEETILQNLAWMCSKCPVPGVPRALFAMAVLAYRSKYLKVGNACTFSLGALPGEESAAQLALLKVKVKAAVGQKAIEKAYSKTAERENIPREDVEEVSVPTYGLTEPGKRSMILGDFTVETKIVRNREITITFSNKAGKVFVSVPAAIKKDFSAELKQLQQEVKDLRNMIPAQVFRVEEILLQKRSWPMQVWRERYLDHPLVGCIARNLIWRFKSSAQTHEGLWLKDKLCDVKGKPLHLPEDSVVALWHPLDSPVETVQLWRLLLEREEIRQPFNQAHRHIYLLAPAEEKTETYSNRFAAHILKQHQFNSLCTERGWKNSLRLSLDDDTRPPTLRLPAWKLRAEFWIGSMGEEDTTDIGTYLYIGTDQVRFYPLDTPQAEGEMRSPTPDSFLDKPGVQPLPLANIPPKVFSEVMRDVDLFVSVAGIANDPEWYDSKNAGLREYWHRNSFVNLEGSGHERKALLQRLMPKLKIAKVCSFDAKSLIVKGKLKTYKIHLGSANVMIQDTNTYLCIVPGNRELIQDVFIPFDGDRTLALVLSKAFLLAADDKITDKTIINQIHRQKGEND